MSLTLQFLGGAKTVTGSKYLLSNGNQKVLIDCGLFQGLKELRTKNWEPLPVDLSSIDAVILTHAHLDHTGYLPLLAKAGWRKPIYCTFPTLDLTKILLYDSAHIQEEDADFANQSGYSKHSPARPLYTVDDVKSLLPLLKPLKEKVWTSILPGFQLRFQNSGHILGSALVELKVAKKTIVFSGDLGRPKPLILKAPSVLKTADILLIESTYGDRQHKDGSSLDKLAEITLETMKKKGHLLVPSFAVGRTQDLLYLFSLLLRQKKIPKLPIYLDSPMGIHATEIFKEYPDWHSLDKDHVEAMYKAATFVKSKQQSKELLSKKKSSVIIAGSGMLSGGRILHHLEKRLDSEKNTILLTGYQAEGTRGRALQKGATEIKFHGHYVPVHARVRELTSLSAHADQKEIVRWLSHFDVAPQRTFIVHGEPHASDALRVRIQDDLGWEASVPFYMETVELA